MNDRVFFVCYQLLIWYRVKCIHWQRSRGGGGVSSNQIQSYQNNQPKRKNIPWSLNEIINEVNYHRSFRIINFRLKTLKSFFTLNRQFSSPPTDRKWFCNLLFKVIYLIQLSRENNIDTRVAQTNGKHRGFLLCRLSASCAEEQYKFNFNVNNIKHEKITQFWLVKINAVFR